MPCCGQGVIVSSMSGLSGNLERGNGAARTTVKFQYTGRTGLTVVGPVTGMQYRFDGPGATLPVDSRDQRSVAAVPKLKRVT